jgi:hypothetical protein
MVHLGSVFRHQVMANHGDNPRIRARVYHRLRYVHWGATYPVFTNMGVIGTFPSPDPLSPLITPAISYALIAPIILGVAFLGFMIIYCTYRYNIHYIYSSELDTRGLHYPRALKQTLVGVYLAEICMIGLLALGKAFGPLVLMFGLLIFTVLIHFSLSAALSPLLFNLPRTLAADEELRRAGHDGLDYIHEEEEQHDPEDPDPYDSDFDPSNPTSHGESSNRAVEGGAQAFSLTSSTITAYLRLKYAKSPLPTVFHAVDFWTPLISPLPTAIPNFFIKFLHPEIFADYHVLRQSLPKDFPEISYKDGETRDAFEPPSMRARQPRLWVPRDRAGVSVQECRHTNRGAGGTEMRDGGAWVGEGRGVGVDMAVDWREDWEKIRY